MDDQIGRFKAGKDATREVRRWTRLLGADEAQSGGALRSGLDAKPGAPGWVDFARETFASLYEGEAQALAASDRAAGADWIDGLHEKTADLAEWQSLAALAKHDPWAAGVATGQILSALAPLVEAPKEDAQSAQEALQAAEEAGDAEGAQKAREALAQAQAAAQAAAKGNEDRAPAVRSAVRRAAKKAGAEIGEIQEAERGLAPGHGSAAATAGGAPDRSLARRLAGDPELRKIAKLAGRLKARAAAQQQARVRAAREEVCDVTTGRDIGRLLPSELAAAAMGGDAEARLYGRLQEGKAACYELRGREPRAEGPIVLCLDESGSMMAESGGYSRHAFSKAAALALCEIARGQKRDFALVHHDGAVTRVDRFEGGTASEAQLLAALGHFTGGGTRIAAAVHEAERQIDAGKGRWKRADLVIITDGLDGSAAETAERVRALRKRGVQAYGIAIDSAFSEPLRSALTSEIRLRGAEIAKADGIDTVLAI